MSNKESQDRHLFALDISMKNTGLTIYNFDKKEFVYIGSFSTQKIYATKKNKGLHLNAVKLRHIIEWIIPLIEKYPPKIVAIERMFSRFNNETQTIAKATGVIQYILWDKPQYLYPPKTVKAAILHGSASKEDVLNAIKTKYNDIESLKDDGEPLNDDESDSFAVALTFLIDNGFIEWEKPLWKDIKKMRES